MRRGNDGTPFGRGPCLRSFFNDFFDDPFFEDPFFQQRSAFFSPPFSSTFFSRPFGGLVDEIFQHRHPTMPSMQGTSAGDYESGPSYQSLPALRVVELEVGETEVASREQPLVEHPDSDAEEEDDDNDGDESQDEDEGPTQAGPYWEHSPKSVRDIPIHWGDEAPAPAESAPAISELDPDMDMDWQPSGATAAAASDHPSPVRFRWPGAGGERHAGGSSESQPELGRRDRERSFPRSWFPHLDRKGPSR
eukprot:TRINITY_DN708_c0_g1_i1.p1 TRINITY_DN708_c0_g1~~TRINITY_DN708_c0_g1_i1.p1  ORF type:complete len:249 (+),score=44.25 TRINITY_DN708_c0_g1_i1:106-852(+)